jgi:serine/threonine-protein kinase
MYVNSGHVLYVHAGSIFAAPFDLAKLVITGTGVPLVVGVWVCPASGAAQFAVARDGRMVYLSRNDAAVREAPIDIVDRQGKSTRLQGAPLNWAALAFSPNGNRLAIDVTAASIRSVWIYDLARGAIQRATFSDVPETRPIWMDDRLLTFAWATAGPPNLYRQAADGGKPERLTESPRVQYPGSWSPDGRSLAFTEIRDGQGDVMILPMEDDAKTGLTPGTPIPLLATSHRESHPAFSPDGKWIAFASSESSTLQVYVTSATDPTRKVQVSIDGGGQPMWSHTSRELVFRTDESASRIFFVTYDTTDGTFRPSRPALWTPTRFAIRSGVSDVALHPDGRRMAGTVVAPDVDAAPNEPVMSLITDFFAVLKAKVK